MYVLENAPQKACFAIFVPVFFLSTSHKVLDFWLENNKALYVLTKVCHEKNYTNSGADNSASRHDSLNLKGSAESGEENE